MLSVPFAPDTIGADIQELNIRTAVISFAQGLEKRGVFLQVDWVGVVRFNTRDAFPATGRIVAADNILEALATRIEKPVPRQNAIRG